MSYRRAVSVQWMHDLWSMPVLPHPGEGLSLRFMRSHHDHHAKIQTQGFLWCMEPTSRRYNLNPQLSLGTESTISDKEDFWGNITRVQPEKELVSSEPKENLCISKVWIGFLFSSVCSTSCIRGRMRRRSLLSIPKSSSPLLTQGGWKSRPGAGFLDKLLI